jgi:protein-S-isoprenylcysteine O-methyltransferase Ste14
MSGNDSLGCMKATNWEFTNRAAVFGMILGCSFAFYFMDQENVTAALAGWSGARWHINGDALARALFFGAAGLLLLAALIRTWASAYLHPGVVYAAEVKCASLVADGPYRQMRNPLYFANVLMAIALGSMMSRIGFFVVVIAMTVFCYRLIFREESELQAAQGQGYEAYRKAVPRLWPSPWPRIAASGQTANWADGFKAESWYWGFALGLLAFAITLKLLLFFVILAASLVLFWILASAIARKANASH